jgi:hypothetical protein
MDRTRSVAVLATVALVAGGAGYYLADPLLGIALALVYGVGSWVTVTYFDALPDTDDWQVSKWNGAWIATATFAGNAVMNNTFEIPLGLGISQMLLVYGAAWVGYMIAVAQLTEAARVQSDPDAVDDSETV